MADVPKHRRERFLDEENLFEKRCGGVEDVCLHEERLVPLSRDPGTKTRSGVCPVCLTRWVTRIKGFGGGEMRR